MGNVLVIGAALSGTAVAQYLNRKGYTVYLTDAAAVPEKAALEAQGIRVYDNGHPDALKQLSYDFIVKNPGIPYRVPFVQYFTDRGDPMLNEIEIALRDQPQHHIGAVTGTNGKTTTTTMLGGMLQRLDSRNMALGNIGTPLCQALAGHERDTLSLAIEISAFQLLGTPHFHPEVSVIMNLTPDHIDYFGSADAYYRAKTLVYRNQGPADAFIRNVDDENVMRYAVDIPCPVIDFSLTRRDVELRLEGDKAYYGSVLLFDRNNFRLPGMHNVENAMIAACMAYRMGVRPEDIQDYLAHFPGVEHRIEFVAEIGGVRYYNDSKGTNVDSTIQALKAFDCPVHLLVGGYDKKTGFDGLKPYLGHVKKMYAYGDTKTQFVPLMKEVALFDTMHDALEAAHQAAQPGEVVLLSPACASWDQFPNFEERGRQFKQQVLGYREIGRNEENPL
jgi:UDP-N-acetylmuramoylalanine--D-glutamate ligase